MSPVPGLSVGTVDKSLALLGHVHWLATCRFYAYRVAKKKKRPLVDCKAWVQL